MGFGEDTSPEIERIAKAVVDSALRVHRQPGLGLLESAYRACLAYELTKRGFAVEQEQPVPVVYDGAQLLTHLKLRHLRLGLLINFNVVLIKEGIRRVLNDSP